MKKLLYNLITSVAPVHSEVFPETIKKWNLNFASVVSLNSKSEEIYFPEAKEKLNIRFTERDYSEEYGRPLISIMEALTHISELTPEGEIIGLVNSDCEPSDYFDWLEYAVNVKEGQIHAFKRTDYENVGGYKKYSPQTYKFGYDLFLMRNNKEVIRSIVKNDYGLAFGVPWWDYWFPCIVADCGIDIISVDYCTVLHCSHTEKYSRKLWVEFGNKFIRYIKNLGVIDISKEYCEYEELINICKPIVNWIDRQKFEKNQQKNYKDGISIVTACMNRNDNLVKAVKSWLVCDEIAEIIIVDWSSNTPVEVTLKDEGMIDSRIKIININGQKHWNLPKAFNVGLKNVSYSRTLKLDADVLIEKKFFNLHPLSESIYYSGSWFTAKNDSEKRLNGSFFVFSKFLDKVGGYNELINTYGWDDSDLYNRVELYCDHVLFNHSTIKHIEQSDISRIENCKIDVNLKSLNSSILSELEIRRNQWKVFLSPPVLDSIQLQYHYTDLSDIEYKNAITVELCKKYEENGLELEFGLLQRLSLDALLTLFKFRHNSIAWVSDSDQLLKKITTLPFYEQDINILCESVYSPYVTNIYANDYPGICKNNFLTSKNTELFQLKQTEDSVSINSCIDEIGFKSINYEVTVPIVVYNADIYINGLLESISDQSYFKNAYFVFIIADFNKYYNIEQFVESNANCTILNLMDDPGLYQCWNYVASKSKSDFLSNWNVDDRRSSKHLEICIKYLRDNPKIDAVSTALYVSRLPNVSYYNAVTNNLEVWFKNSDFDFDLSDMFQYKNWVDVTDPSYGQIVSCNLLHCMPVWRRSVHFSNGYFDEYTYGASADWEFWLRCSLNGSVFHIISSIEGVYFLNQNSYGRASENVECGESKIFSRYLKYSRLTRVNNLSNCYDAF